jgi:hypothetical protein
MTSVINPGVRVIVCTLHFFYTGYRSGSKSHYSYAVDWCDEKRKGEQVESVFHYLKTIQALTNKARTTL